MNELEKYKSELAGKKLVKILHTDQGTGVEHLYGLGNAYYFTIVLELENSEKYVLRNDWIDKWNSNEKLYEVTHKNWEINYNNKFNNLIISNILTDQYNDIYIKLENGIIIYHKEAYGDKLFFDKFSDLFTSNGKRINENKFANNGPTITSNELQTKKIINKTGFWSKLKNMWS